MHRCYPDGAEYAPYEASPIADAAIPFDSDTALAVAEASSAIGSTPRLPAAGIAAVLYRSESCGSSLIEGVGPGPRRILEAEIADETEIDDPAARRVVRNLAALRDAIATPVPAQRKDLLRWHMILMDRDPLMDRKHAGAFRTMQNWIGGDASEPRGAEFIPPRPEQVRKKGRPKRVFAAASPIDMLT